MGLFFSNIHIKKNEFFNPDTLIKILKDDMAEKGFKESDNLDDAEISLCIYSSKNSDWVSIASDCFNFTTSDSTKAAATPFSEAFRTDVIAAMCVDSDYLMLNLINTEKGTDGWINSGSLYGEKLPRRTSIAPWKTIVSDYEKFREIVKSKDAFAESVLYESATLLGMNLEQCGLQPDVADIDNKECLAKLYFSLPEGVEKELPKLAISLFSLIPCQFDRNSVVFVNNKGGRGKGVAVMFWGDYVENDEVTIENVTFESDYGSDRRKVTPITLKKVKCNNGELALYWEDRNFIIPKAVNQSLPYSKLSQLEFEKEFGVRFFVKGNPRKLLDIKVSIIPLENYANGSDTWFVYRFDKTKQLFIERHNRTWKDSEEMQLNPNDFDL